MAKAINWPAEFRDEVMGEDTEALRCAVRLGTLYYNDRYWAPDEVVDIRVGHLKIRKGQVVGDLKACALKDLSAEDLACQKRSLRTIPELVAFLARTYQQPVTPETVVTVVYYRNLPLVPEEVEVQDDPHM